ncbi:MULTISPECIES: 16S rRNA (guanine(966)-N(2))-methyltransferase RsmD [Gulosibacter]|uniref:16S rRNA (guanine(966)-N(2))-methyltransferase RsmD n=1 Tax=Gulosibacter TaxID=256818 RepID=UPI000F63D556|nr:MULTISPECIES: 16S rRNA (guanine(966)-N(2))-methyltransferase RsmD [Gulosibacter]
MTRIIGGQAAAVRLEVPPRGTRPTSDKVREAMFSTLDSAFELDGARVLDLYAGTGALGLEALSRGAESVVLVEKSEQAARLLRTNARAVSRQLPRASASVENSPVARWLARGLGEFDLVFIDPPYDVATATVYGELELLLPLLSPDALVVVERSSRSDAIEAPEGYVLWRQKDYGETVVRYFELASR